MKPRRRFRFTLWQLMLTNLVVGVWLALPRVLNSPDRVIAFSAAVILSVLCLFAAVAEVVLSKRCPNCSRWSLRRLARHSSYYLCTSCRARLKRAWLGPWRDASGPEDAARYERRSHAGIWKGYAPPGELDGSGSGHLLQIKRARDPIDEIRRHPRPIATGRGPDRASAKVRRFLLARREDDDV